MTITTIRKWGSSLAVRIPQEVSELVKITDGVEVEMCITKNKEILLRPAFSVADDQENLRKHFLSLRAKCKPGTTVHEETFAEPMGDEQI